MYAFAAVWLFCPSPFLIALGLLIALHLDAKKREE